MKAILSPAVTPSAAGAPSDTYPPIQEAAIEAFVASGTPAAPLPVLRSIRHTAKVFSRTPRTIRQWIADGHLPVIRVGRAVFVKQDDIDELLGIDPE